MNPHGALVIGAGPAGLRAAEILATAGIETRIFEQKPSLGRKFLVAGRGGLNITHAEGYDLFVSRYDSPARWERMLQSFRPDELRAWFEKLGVGDREKPGAERIAILGLGPGDYRGACLLRQVETMF